MITKDSQRIATNKLPLKVQLMPHQKAIIYEMVMVENKVKNMLNSEYAMMSDKPGAGKTYAILAFLYFSDMILFGGKMNYVNLIVVPYNICSQWKQSIERIFGKSSDILNYKILIDYSDIMRLYVDPTELMRYNIILTTSLLFDNLANTINSLNMQLKRVFFDEADTIQNLMQTPLNCRMSWFVSASMESLFSKGEYNVTIGKYKLSMEHLKHYDVKCDSDFVNENIVLDAPIIHQVKCQNIYYQLLKDIVPAHLHKNIDAMDYRCIRSEFVQDIDIINSEYCACNYVFKDAIAKEKHALEQINMLNKEYESLINRSKGVYDEEVKQTILKKAQDVDKYIKYYQSLCSKCQQQLDTIKAFINKYDITEAFEEKPSESKRDRIEDIIKKVISKNPNDQCLLFTNYDYIYTFLTPFLDKENISYRFLDGGNMNIMDNIITSYKKREFNILFADSSMYSCGMNLENTDHIILLHKMDNQREKQVIGRAHRYGRQQILNVWYFEYD